jgi:hypothetical protein
MRYGLNMEAMPVESFFFLSDIDGASFLLTASYPYPLRVHHCLTMYVFFFFCWSRDHHNVTLYCSTERFHPKVHSYTVVTIIFVAWQESLVIRYFFIVGCIRAPISPLITIVWAYNTWKSYRVVITYFIHATYQVVAEFGRVEIIYERARSAGYKISWPLPSARWKSHYE